MNHAAVNPFEYKEGGTALLERFVESVETSRQPAITASFLGVRALDELSRAVERKAAVAFDRLQRSFAAASAAGGGAPGLQPPTEVMFEEVDECVRFEVESAELGLQIMNNCYSTVDNTVKDLDRRLRLLENLLRHQGHTAVVAEEGGPSGAAAAKADSISARTRHRPSAGDGAAAARRGGGGDSGATTTTTTTGDLLRSRIEESLAAAQTQPFSALMEHDPSEPTYCVCRQVAFGEMIECDNAECPIGWYHYSCVGLGRSSRPHGRWLCPDCAKQAAQKGGRSRPASASGFGVTGTEAVVSVTATQAGGTHSLEPAAGSGATASLGARGRHGVR